MKGFVTVFPTPVGVFLATRRRLDLHRSLPHARGGVSRICAVRAIAGASSPRPWGCFRGRDRGARLLPVFPTPVGVFLSDGSTPGAAISLPHARGGVSSRMLRAWCSDWSSPRPWGCFLNVLALLPVIEVFPTPVGVFPTARPFPAPSSRLPHARGGVSDTSAAWSAANPSSPRPWGCFYH